MTRNPIQIPHRISSRLFPVCFFLLISSGGACAAIYKWVDADGRVQFSDQAPAESGVEEVHLPEINSYEGVEIQDVQSARPTTGPIRTRSGRFANASG